MKVIINSGGSSIKYQVIIQALVSGRWMGLDNPNLLTYETNTFKRWKANRF
jgi:acetate kinase